MGRPEILALETMARKSIICVYLGLRSLDWDNRDSISAYSSFGYEKDPIFPYFNQIIQLCQHRILGIWPLDGPTILTKVDTWIKRKRSYQQILFRRGDYESIIKWNMILVQEVVTNYLQNMQFPDVKQAIFLLQQILKSCLESSPISRCSLLLDSFDLSSFPEVERIALKSLITSASLFQKLKLENDAIGFLKGEPFLASEFENLLYVFGQAKRSSPLLSQVSQELRSAEMKLFSAQFSLLSCNNQQKQEQFTLYLKNQRILKRIALKLNSRYSKLQDSLFTTAISVENRMPKIEGYNSSSVPFPKEDYGEEILRDLAYVL